MDTRAVASHILAIKLECIAILAARYGASRDLSEHDAALKAMSDVAKAINAGQLVKLHESLFGK